MSPDKPGPSEEETDVFPPLAKILFQEIETSFPFPRYGDIGIVKGSFTVDKRVQQKDGKAVNGLLPVFYVL